MRFGEGEGRPDGAALDRSGNYWIACLEAGTIEVRTPAGDACRSLRPDTPRIITKLAFGPEGRLFVTSKAAPALPLSGLLTCTLPRMA